jgi:hypothetical protein
MKSLVDNEKRASSNRFSGVSWSPIGVNRRARSDAPEWWVDRSKRRTVNHVVHRVDGAISQPFWEM